jgi:hypothetical protein
VLASCLVTGLLVLGLGTGAERFFRPPPGDVREILSQPDRIESFSIEPELAGSAYADEPERIAGHRVRAAGRTATGRRAKRFVDLLLDEESYRIAGAGDHKPCEFRPEHALRFVRRDRSTVVLICLPCARLTFESGGGDFDPVARELEARIRSLVEKTESEGERERPYGEGQK